MARLFSLEIALALGRMLCLDRFTLRVEADRVLAGWDGKLVDLGAFAAPAGDHPILVFNARGSGAPRFIDYFRGTLLTPTVGQKSKLSDSRREDAASPDKEPEEIKEDENED